VYHGQSPQLGHKRRLRELGIQNPSSSIASQKSIPRISQTSEKVKVAPTPALREKLQKKKLV